MFSKKRIITAVLAGVLALSMFTACTTVPSGTTSSNGTASGTDSSSTDNGGAGNNATATDNKYPGTPNAGEVIINLGADPGDMNSITATTAPAGDVFRHVMDGLTTLDENDNAIPGVAEKWTTSEDGLTWTFNLRKDYKWSNGDPVTAKDFEFSFRALIDPAFASNYSYMGYVFENAEDFNNSKITDINQVGIKAIDDYTLELKLAYNVAYLPELLAFMCFLPVNQTFYEAQDDAYATTSDKMLYNGPFVIESWTPETEFVLVKNPNFPDGDKIKLNKINMLVVKDANTAMNLFKSNQLDMMGLNSEQLAMMQGEGQPTGMYNDGAVSYLEFNFSDKILANKNIRKALQLGINGPTFVSAVVANSSQASTGYTPPGIMCNLKDFQQTIGEQFKPYDLEAAKKYLADGMKELNIASADKIELTFLTEDSDVAAKYAAFIQENLQNDLGIKVKIEQMPFAVKIDRIQNKNFQVCMSLWGPDYNDPMTYLDMFETGGGNNHGGFSNEAYDTLLDEIRVEMDAETRFNKLVELEKILADEAPIAPYQWRFRDYTTSAKLQGVVRSTFQSIQLRWATAE